MRITLNPITLTTDLASGVVNVYKRADGRLVTGKKAYASPTEAARRSRPADNWQRVGTVDVREYNDAIRSLDAINAAMSAAKSSLIRSAETWLSGKLGVTAVLPTEPQHTPEVAVGGYDATKAPRVREIVKAVRKTGSKKLKARVAKIIKPKSKAKGKARR